MSYGPQNLLDSAALTRKQVMTGTICYHSWADDKTTPGHTTYGRYGHDETTDPGNWSHACFSDLSCIKSKVVGTPAFMTLRIGLPEKSRECDEAYIRFITDPELSPWRTYADELFPQEPMTLDYKGEKVNVNSFEFRRDIGIMILKPVSQRIAINFLKAYRLLGEWSAYIEIWYEFVQAGFSPTDAFWCAQFCGPMGEGYELPHYWTHNVFEFRQTKGFITELLNMRASNLDRETFEDDVTILKSNGDRSDYSGCDNIFVEAKAKVPKLGIPEDWRHYLSAQKRGLILKDQPVMSGGLRSRALEPDKPCDKHRTYEFFREFLRNLEDKINESIR